MIGRIRLVVYGVVIALSTLLSILSTYDQIDREVHRPDPTRMTQMIRRSKPVVTAVSTVTQLKEIVAHVEPIVLKKTPVKPVIAPWTTLISKGGHTFPRSFIFSEVAKLDDYGLKLRKYDDEQRKTVRKLLVDRLCHRAKKFASTKYDAQKCDQGLELWKCTTCSELDGSWYVASSVTGSAFGKADQDNTIRFPFYNDGPFMYQQLDIVVPIAHEDEKLMAFARHLGSSVKKFRESLQGRRVAVRLMITRFLDEAFESDEEQAAFQNTLIKKAELGRPGDSVEFINVAETAFSRAKAVNALHAAACHSDDCVLACTDVDMRITSHFLRNALMLAFPGASAYFPIMWSEFNPETTQLTDKFLPGSAKWVYTDHHGYWRKSSYGMYVIAGSDAKILKMSEKFVGWGGEDNDFFGRVGEKLNIIRMHEKGLTHVWHQKDCKLGSFVEGTYYKACIGAKAHTEGSQLGLYLRSLRHEDPALFNSLMAVKSKPKVEPEEEEEEADDASTEKISVMIAVITSRANIGTRVATIMKTWGKPDLVPDGITIKFFVGKDDQDDTLESGSEKDLENLARQAGIPDTSMIFVMTDVKDNEYPPVRKNSAMIRHLDEIVTAYENDETSPSTYQWAYKVDDDAYVNLHGLLRFVTKRNPVGYHVYGERGYGRQEDHDGLKKGGMKKPYCTGGPGYIFSRPTLKRTALGMDQCVKNADTSLYRDYLWHSDVVIGLCAEQQTGEGCWSDDDYSQKRVFRNNYDKDHDLFVPDEKLEWIIAMHPFKDEASMLLQHQRYVNMKLIGVDTKA